MLGLDGGPRKAELGVITGEHAWTAASDRQTANAPTVQPMVELTWRLYSDGRAELEIVLGWSSSAGIVLGWSSSAGDCVQSIGAATGRCANVAGYIGLTALRPSGCPSCCPNRKPNNNKAMTLTLTYADRGDARAIVELLPQLVARGRDVPG